MLIWLNSTIFPLSAASVLFPYVLREPFRLAYYSLTPVIQAHQELYSAMKKRGISWDVRKEYQGNDFFTGVSLTLHVSYYNVHHSFYSLTSGNIHSG